MERSRLRLPLLVAAFAAGLFANSVGNDFVLDDLWIVKRNPLVHDLSQASVIFRSNYWSAKGKSAGLYRPVTILSYALNYAVNGLNPHGYHLVNVGLHALNSALVALLLLMIWRLPAAALAGGLLFAAHPIHAEAVASIVGRAELLSTAFALLMLLLHRLVVVASGRRRQLYYGASLLAFLTGVMAKETAITFVIVPVLHDLLIPAPDTAWRDRLERVRRQWPLYAGHAGVAVLYLLIRVAVLGRLTVPTAPFIDNPLVEAGGPSRLASAIAIAARYLWLLLWPAKLSSDYGYNVIAPVRHVFDPWFLAGLAALSGTLWFGWTCRRSPRVLFPLLLAAAPYSVAANFPLLIGTPMAERLLYLPSVGLCVLAGLAISRLAHLFTASAARARLAVFGVTALLVVPLSARTWLRNRDWSDHRSLFVTDVAAMPDSVKLNYNAGWACVVDDDPAAARPYLERCLELYEDFPRAWVYLAKAEGKLGDHAREAELYEEARRRFPDNAWVLSSVAGFYAENDELAKAREAYEAALEGDPTDDDARLGLGLVLFSLGEYEAAVGYLEPVLNVPDDSMERQLFCLAEALDRLDRTEAAETVRDRLCRRFPDSPRVRDLVTFGPARRLLAAKRYAEAVPMLEALRREKKDGQRVRYLLGLAQFNLKNYEAAVTELSGELHLESETAQYRRAVALGNSLEHLERYPEAATIYREALAAVGERPTLLEHLGYVEYSHLRDYPHALPHLQRLLELRPNHPKKSGYERAIAYMKRRVPALESTPAETPKPPAGENGGGEPR